MSFPKQSLIVSLRSVLGGFVAQMRPSPAGDSLEEAKDRCLERSWLEDLRWGTPNLPYVSRNYLKASIEHGGLGLRHPRPTTGVFQGSTDYYVLLCSMYDLTTYYVLLRTTTYYNTLPKGSVMQCVIEQRENMHNMRMSLCM